MIFRYSATLFFVLMLMGWSGFLLGDETDALSPVAQQELVRELGNKVQQFEMWTDNQGHVTGLVFINHQTLTKSVGEKPGIDDTDLLSLSQLPKLTALNLEAQPVGDRSLRVLRQFPKMKQVGFHYMAKANGATATPEFITSIDGMQDLEILEIKHNFKMKSIAIDKLQGPFPKVWRLVVDTPVTAEQTLHLLSLCPNVTDLQLHRSGLTVPQLQAATHLVPKLEVLWLKPQGELTPEHLAAVSQWEGLKIFSPQAESMLAWDDGWDHLTKLKSLERLEMAKSLRGKNELAIEKLLEAKPGLIVDDKLTRSRNYAGP